MGIARQRRIVFYCSFIVVVWPSVFQVLYKMLELMKKVCVISDSVSLIFNQTFLTCVSCFYYFFAWILQMHFYSAFYMVFFVAVFCVLLKFH